LKELIGNLAHWYNPATFKPYLKEKGVERGPQKGHPHIGTRSMHFENVRRNVV